MRQAFTKRNLGGPMLRLELFPLTIRIDLPE